jgi:NADPH:quinone reductase-like Zn-dependent oxidoreductase
VRAVVVHETGGPEVLRLEEVERPTPTVGEVLVRVRAAAVNPIDWKYRRGLSPKALPAILGNDFSGTVEESRAEGYNAGDDVLGMLSGGAYAAFATASAGATARKPSGVSDEEAAALPVAGLTAWQSLFDVAGLESGQSVLIAGAAGGVGHLAVQFARHAGARVVGIGSSRNHDFVLGLGADEYVDYKRDDVTEAVSGIDVAFDAVGGEMTPALARTVREGGVLVTIASAPPEDAARERGFRAQLHVTNPDSGQLARIVDLVAAGDVRVEVAEVLPLDEVGRAHEMSESGHVRGKVVLAIEP